MGGGCCVQANHPEEILQQIQIQIISPAPGCIVQVGELGNVLAVLKKAAPLLGLDQSDARWLQLESSNATLAHGLQLKQWVCERLCEQPQCSVLGVEERLKAKTIDIVQAARHDRVAEVRLVCKYATDRVKEKEVLLLLHTHWR